MNRLRRISILYADLESGERFWRDVMGFRVQWREQQAAAERLPSEWTWESGRASGERLPARVGLAKDEMRVVLFDGRIGIGDAFEGSALKELRYEYDDDEFVRLMELHMHHRDARTVVEDDFICFRDPTGLEIVITPSVHYNATHPDSI